MSYFRWISFILGSLIILIQFQNCANSQGNVFDGPTTTSASSTEEQETYFSSPVNQSLNIISFNPSTTGTTTEFAIDSFLYQGTCNLSKDVISHKIQIVVAPTKTGIPIPTYDLLTKCENGKYNITLHFRGLRLNTYNFEVGVPSPNISTSQEEDLWKAIGPSLTDNATSFLITCIMNISITTASEQKSISKKFQLTFAKQL